MSSTHFRALLLTALATVSMGFAPLRAAESPAETAKRIRKLLEAARGSSKLPAVAAAVIADGKLVAAEAVGVRKFDQPVQVTSKDAFHIGSCGKAATATLIALLIEQKKLGWETTLAEAFPDLASAMNAAYRPVTLEQLLAHRAGLPANGPAGTTPLDIHRLPGRLPHEQRQAFVAMVLKAAPEYPPGEQFQYSNAGYAIAGAMAERAAKAPYEELLLKMVLRPLGITTAGFGAMANGNQLNQPWQHKVMGNQLLAIGGGPMGDNPPALSPAGRIHMSIGDLARFVGVHVGADPGGKPLLRPDTLQRLHTPAFGGDYAGGWLVTERDWGGGTVLTHAGSNTLSYCVIWAAPRRKSAVMVATNVGPEHAAKACDDLAGSLIQQFLPPASTR
jgi:CubicO group peptidase (beta-lactamase class C family)